MSGNQPDGVIMRDALRDDISTIVSLYRDGLSARHRDAPPTPVPDGYYRAFEAIEADPRNRLIVAELDGNVVGTIQVTLLIDMSPRARDHMLIENVVVDASMRGQRIGERMMRWAMEEASRLGCDRLQLTSNAVNTDAHRFYERLGFVASHRGFRFQFEDADG